MTAISSVTPLAPEPGFKALVRRHQVVAMVLIMFVLAWPVLILDALASRGLAARPSILLEFATGWAPAIAAILVAALLSGRPGVRELLRGLLAWRVSPGWYAAALFMLAAFILGGIGLSVSLGGALPEIPAAQAPLWNVALAFAIVVVLGVLFNTEEIAWRGFALPRLQARYGVFGACLLLALPEALFHLPYFWNTNVSFYQTVGMFWFTAFGTAAVFIYAYLFNKTKGSLLIVTLMHASQNAWANLLSDNSLRPFIFTVALMWMVALALIFITKGRLGYEPEP